MITFTTLLFTATFALAYRYRSRRLAAERKRQLVQTWPRAIAALIGPLPKSVPLSILGSDKDELPTMEYQYSVRQTQYTGRYLSPAQDHITPRTDERALLHLSTSREWRVYYNPQNHSEAYLSPGPPQVQNIHLMLDFFFLVFAPAVMIFSWYGIITHS
jgi:hypothetical protein